MHHFTRVKLCILSTTPLTASPVQHRGEDSLVSAIFQKINAQHQTSLKKSIVVGKRLSLVIGYAAKIGGGTHDLLI